MSGAASRELRHHRDLNVALDRLRQRAVLLRGFRRLYERGLIDVRNPAAHVECAAGHFGRAVYGFDRDGRARFDARRGVTGLLEGGRERHAEAAGVSGGEQLFGVRPFLSLEARTEAERAAEDPALRLEAAFAVLELAFPNGYCVTCRHRPDPGECREPESGETH